MGEQFDKELQKAEKLSKYNMSRASRLLDDMATAYLSDEFHGLDKSLVAIKTAKKAMRAQGIKQDIIDEYFLQRSYLSKTQLRQFVNDSIYTGDSLRPEVENIVALHMSRTTTDLIIDGLHNRPELLSALQRGVQKATLVKTYGMHNPVLLQNFYNKHKDIIDN